MGCITVLFLLGFVNTCLSNIPMNDVEIWIADYKDDKQCAISYTFDDGLLEHYTLVYPQLEKLGFKATFWICGKIIESKGGTTGIPRMTWDQMKEMARNGHEISNHGWSHLVLRNKEESTIRTEIALNDSIITTKIGKRPLTFCYPGNFVDERAIRIASRGRVGTRLKQYAIGGEKSQSTQEGLNNWLDELLRTKQWAVTMTHGITYGYDHFIEPSVLWNHLEQVKSKQDSVWVDTFQSIATYVKVRENTILDIQKSDLDLCIIPRTSLDDKIYRTNLTLVVKVNKKIAHIVQNGKKIMMKKRKDVILFDINPYEGEILITFQE